MAIDPSIVLGVRPAQFNVQDPIEQYGKAVQLKALMGQGQLQDLQMRQAMQAEQDEGAVRDAYKQSGGDSTKLRDLLINRGAYKQVQAQDKFNLEQRKTQAGISKDEADAAGTKSKQDIAALSHGANLLANSKNQADYDAAISIIDRLSPGAGANLLKVMPVFDPAKAQQLAQAGLTRAEQLKSENDAATRVETGRHNKESERAAMANVGIAGGNLSLSRQRFDLDKQRFESEQNTPQYMQTDSGLVALPKRPAPGAIAGQVVTGPDGQTLGRPLKDIPASVNTAIISNNQNLNRAKEALKLLEGGTVGSAVGDKSATGVKGYLPNGLLNRMDSSGVDTRAAISDLGSMILHDRSGAAVTAAESPRLMPFIPLSTDDAATASKKLKRFIQVYEQEQGALNDTYNKDQGYRPSPVIKSQNSAQAPTVDSIPGQKGAVRIKGDDGYNMLKSGDRYIGPDGIERTKP